MSATTTNTAELESANDRAVRAFLHASSEVLRHAFGQAANGDAEGADYLAAALNAGALVKLTATFAYTTGLVHMNAEVVEPNGRAHSLASMELQREGARQ